MSRDFVLWSKDFLIGLAVGVLIGFILSKLSARRAKDRIVWSETVDPSKIDPQVVALATGGQKIQAIKRYRELYKVDLKEAKDAVDAIAEQPPKH